MTDQEVKEAVAEIVGCSSYDHFLSSTGLGVFINRSTYNPGIQINNETDKLYKSYTRPTYVMCKPSLDKAMFIADIDEVSLKTRVSAKVRQTRVLEQIKQTGIKTIKDYITKVFELPEGLIETSDIEFQDYWTFVIAGVIFRYSGTISGKDFIINNYEHLTHEDMYKSVMTINAYFELKQASRDI